MWATGLMTRFNPFEAGGAEPTFREMIQTWIDMATLDGSFGWIGIANLPSAAAIAAYLPDAGFAEVFTANHNRVTLGGQFFPNGTGNAVDGGYQVTGAWNFGSGTGHSEYVAAGFMPMVDGELVFVAEGIPELRVAIVAARGRALHRRLARPGPEGHRFLRLRAHRRLRPRVSDLPAVHSHAGRGAAPTFAMGIMPIVAAGHASWALGVARSMIDDVRELAVTKIRMGDPSTLANKASFQVGLAHHECMWRAARLLVEQTFGDVEATVGAGHELTPTMRADMRRGRGLRDQLLARDRPVGAPGCGNDRHPGGQSAGARLPRPLHGHPARLHRREGGDRLGAGLARPRRRSSRSLSQRRGDARF